MVFGQNDHDEARGVFEGFISVSKQDAHYLRMKIFESIECEGKLFELGESDVILRCDTKIGKAYVAEDIKKHAWTKQALEKGASKPPLSLSDRRVTCVKGGEVSRVTKASTLLLARGKEFTDGWNNFYAMDVERLGLFQHPMYVARRADVEKRVFSLLRPGKEKVYVTSPESDSLSIKAVRTGDDGSYDTYLWKFDSENLFPTFMSFSVTTGQHTTEGYSHRILRDKDGVPEFMEVRIDRISDPIGWGKRKHHYYLADITFQWKETPKRDWDTIQRETFDRDFDSMYSKFEEQ